MYFQRAMIWDKWFRIYLLPHHLLTGIQIQTFLDGYVEWNISVTNELINNVVNIKN